MSVETPTVEIHYPESDGKPMGETDLHRDWMFRIIDLLKQRYRDQPVYVSGDLLVYYEEGNPYKFVVPDAFVVKDCDPRRRRLFKVWEEQRVPNVVFETTSESTRMRDIDDKPTIYAALGVAEYFMYDPTADYLDPPLVGLHLIDSDYERIEPNSAGRLLSRELGAEVFLDGDELAMCDARSGERLMTAAEAAEAEAIAAEAKARAAEAKAKAKSAEVERLRRKLREHGIEE